MQSRQDLALALKAADAEAIQFVVGPGRDIWDVVCESEGWPVGVISRHLCLWQERFAAWIEAVRSKRPIVVGDLHGINAAEAAEGLTLTPSETADLIRRTGSVLVAALEEMTDEDYSSVVTFWDEPTPVSEVFDIFVSHIQEHLATMREAAGTST